MKDFTKLVDLASETLGGRAIAANDEFFASKNNLLKAAKPVFIEGKYTARGKWMDGWETRRRRTPGHDWCILRLGLPGVIRGVIVDTSFFKGNYPQRCSIEACNLGADWLHKKEKALLTSTGTSWHEVLPETLLAGDTQNAFPVDNNGLFTHLRLKIYPDGGVARLRVHGEVIPDLSELTGQEADLGTIERGGTIISASDDFFGTPLNLLMPGHARNTGGGWETRRRRGPGHDWVIAKLGVPGKIRHIEVNTSHFKGNFPESCSLEACHVSGPTADPGDPSIAWKPLLARTPLKANYRHRFRSELENVGVISHVRLNIFPDGGVSRLRLFGIAEGGERSSNGVEQFNNLSEARARKALLDCCGSKKWVAAVLTQRPFQHQEHLLQTADRVWAGLRHADWMEAFRHHPAIGSKRAETKQTRAAQELSAREQSAAQKSAPETLDLLAEANVAYRSKFGHVFLICATGKSGGEILNDLRKRISNDPDTELNIAAEEHRKITRIRLQRLLES